MSSPTGARTGEDVHETWGWIQFFTEHSQFLLSLERQYGLANDSFAEYAVSRLTLCIRGVSFMCSVISEEEENASGLEECLSHLNAVCGAFTSLLDLWQRYDDTLESVNYGSGMGYTAPVEHTTHRGRPRFVVSGEQLEYLRSLIFVE